MTQSLSSTFSLSPVGDKQIIIKRQFNAPRELVFKACSSCEHLMKWLGPKFLTMVSCEMDFRAGGSYRYVQKSPDGVEYGFRGEYREIVPPEKVVQTFEFELMPGHIAVETITLEDIDGRTQLTVNAVYQSKDDREGIIASGMEAGVRDSYDRLEEYLATIA